MVRLFQVVSASVGFAITWLTIGPMTLYLASVGTLVGALVVYLIRVFAARPVSVAVAPLSGALTVSWLGLLLAFGLGGVLWAATLATTLPPVMSWWWPRRPRKAPTARDVADVAGLDLESLCLLWRRSYVQLQKSGLRPEDATLVRYRQLVLDELSTRDPLGMERWLASGPRAAGDPLPFLRPDDEEPSGVS